MKRNLLLIITVLTTLATSAQISLDSCRRMALHNNKELQTGKLKIESARYQQKVAHAAYLPSLDLQGAYFYNQKKIELIGEDARLPVMNFDPASGGYQHAIVTTPQGPLVVNGTPVPQQVALLPKSALTYDIHNVFAGALTITQPIFMGGKIKAMNDITKLATQLAQSQLDTKTDEVIYNVDVAYWQVVSLKAKQRLAESYVSLVRSLNNDVRRMVDEGVATKANLLSVDVKLNEANVDLTRVNNGLALSKMLLAQLCGMNINHDFVLADENRDSVPVTLQAANFNMADVYAQRHEIRSLELATQIYDGKARAERAAMLPKVAAMAMYSVSNPNSFHGFKNRFGGAFSVGATFQIPLWHWGGLSNKYRQAQTEAKIKRMELDDAKDKIELQVNQASFRYQEAVKTLDACRSNLSAADENLRMAQVAFREGVSTTDEVMAAQTAWLKANSEKIDAEIDVQLCDVYLSKVLGNMQY